MQTKVMPSQAADDDAALTRPALPQLILRPSWHQDHAAIERRLAFDDWPYMVRHFGDEQLAKRFLSQRIPAYGGLCYPHAANDRIYSIERMMNVTTLMDDAFTTLGRHDRQVERDMLRLHFMDALNGVAPPPDYPLAQLLYDTLEPMRAQLEMKPGVWRRLSASIYDQIVMQAEATSISASTLSLEQYLALRRVEGFGNWITMLTEYAIDVDMESAFECDPTLVTVHHATIDSVILVNDLFSFRKESLAGEPFNAVWWLMRENGLDAEHALRRLSALCEINEMKLLNAQAKVLAGELGARSDVQAYMRELAHMSAGNAEFHAFSKRYHGSEI